MLGHSLCPDLGSARITMNVTPLCSPEAGLSNGVLRVMIGAELGPLGAGQLTGK